MGSIELDSSQGPVTFNIKGDEPSRTEMIKIQKALRGLELGSNVEDSTLGTTSSNQIGQEFDRTTGIQDAGLRADLSIADKLSEQVKVLQNNGLDENDYTTDLGGQLAVTPSGAKKLGIETTQNIIIDEKGFTSSDLSDIAGIAPEVTGAVTGAIIGQAVIPIPFVGAIIGSAIGGGAGNLAEEIYEAVKGFSDQSAGEIAKQTGKEALIAGAFEGAGQVLFKTLGKLFSPSGSRLSPEDLKLAGESMEAGITPNLSSLGSASLISRQQALAERIFKSSKRLTDNHNAITAKIAKFREDAGASDINDLGRILKEAAETGNTKLLKEEAELSAQIVAHMSKAADELGMAAKVDASAINQELFDTLSQSFKYFDDSMETAFKKIDAMNTSTLGNSDIIPSGSLKVLVNKLGGTKRFQDLPRGSETLTGQLEILNYMGKIGDRSSFAKLYTARKYLLDMKMNYGKEQGIYNTANKFIDEIDDILSRKNLEGLEFTKFRGLEAGARPRKKLLEAADQLKEKRKLFALGMKKFDALEHSSIMKDIANTVRNNKPVDASRMQSSILKPNAPERLTSLKKVLDDQADRMNKTSRAGTPKVESQYEFLRSKMAGEWLKENIDNAVMAKNANEFSGKAFAKAYRKLGTTADELFGPKAAEVKKLVEQMDALSLKSVDESVIGVLEEGKVFADDGINLLRGLLNKRKDLNKFQKNNLINKLRNGTLDDVEAAAYINNPATKASDVEKVMAYFTDDASREVLKGSYMDNLIGDFDAKFLTDPTQFRSFADRLTKNQSKNAQIFGDEMAKDMAQFGKILKFNAKSAEGGELIAATIAANPLQNLGRLAKFTALGRMFSSQVFYKNFKRDYKRAIDSGYREPLAFSDVFTRLLTQFTGQASSQGISKETDRVKNLITNTAKANMRPKTPARTPTRNTPVPDVKPGALSNLPYKVVPPSPLSAKTSIRQRAMGDPTVAATLLGGLGSADLLKP